MSISFACPTCDYLIKTPDEFAGRRAKCPKCSAPITVPSATAEPVDVAEPAIPEATAPAPVIIPATTAAAHAAHANDHYDDDHDHDDDDHDDDDDEEHAEHGLLPHKDHPHEDLIDMTPMVDIVFFLLIFFLTTSMTALQAVMNLPNPQKATDKGAAKSVSQIASESDTLMVMIHEDDTFWIDDEQCPSDQDLRMKIQAAVAESAGKPLTLVVVGAADASHGAAIRAFDAGAAARVGNISLLVKEELDDGK
jgi:biopolymer transport protein ExbD